MAVVVGWDIGGAHLKAARAENGRIVDAVQIAAPLRLGLDALARAFAQAKPRMGTADQHVNGNIITSIPNYTQRVLERVEPLQELAPAAAAAHEWINGQGYHQQLIGEQIPLNGRILAVADTYAQLTQQQGDQVEPADALRKMRPLVGTQFDGSCYEALAASLTSAYHVKRIVPRRRQLGDPSLRSGQALTEREAELLRLLAQGQSNPQIAKTLVISRKTVEHHLEHIYNKIGVTCRTSAVVYAVQHGIA